MSKAIGIIGSRERDSHEDLIQTARAFMSVFNEGDVIVSGGAKRGGDRFAEVIAQKKGVPIRIYRPKVKKGASRKEWIKAAFDRNNDVVNDIGNSGVLIACMKEGGSSGTMDAIMKAREKYPSMKIIFC